VPEPHRSLRVKYLGKSKDNETDQSVSFPLDLESGVANNLELTSQFHPLFWLVLGVNVNNRPWLFAPESGE
jgi:hypothetical protein